MASGPIVLVVDDDALSRQIVAHSLAAAGIQCASVESGEQALAWIQEKTPSLILLDLVMPAPGGIEVLQAIRASPGTRNIPVVVLTSLDSDDDVVGAFGAGADDFIRKPFRPAELVARIRGQLRLRDYVDEIASKQRDAQIVLELTQTLASSLDLHQILFTVVKRIAEFVHVDRCSIVVVEDPGEIGCVVATSDDQKLHDLQIRLDRYPEIRQVMMSGRPLVIDNAATHPLLEVVRSHVPSYAVTSLAIVPISYEDRPFGVLFLRARQQVAFGEHELSVARTVANATAIALRNARVIQRLKDRTERVAVARVNAERHLRLLKRYAAYFESAADGIMVIDGEGRILFSNPRARQIASYDEEELRGRKLDEMVVTADQARVQAVRAGFARGVYPQNEDIRVRREDGGEIVLSANFSSVLREENAILLSFRDVTRERAVDAELKTTKGFLERVIDSSPDAIISVDSQGVVRLFNRAAERCFGIRAHNAVGVLSARSLFPSQGAEEVLSVLAPASKGADQHRRLEDYRTEVLTASHEAVPVSLSAAQILEDGHHEGTVIVLTDLRDKLHMEARLAAAQEELQSREKQAIIAELAGAAAHELNQPLTSVMGYAELLKRRLDPSTPACDAVEVIMNEAERMAEIVRKIGKITRYETKSYVGAAKILDLDRASDETSSSARR